MGVQALATDRAYAVGSAGSVLFTEDGGLTWMRQWSTVEHDLMDVLFLSNVTGFAVGLGVRPIASAPPKAIITHLQSHPWANALCPHSVALTAHAGVHHPHGGRRQHVDAYDRRALRHLAELPEHLF